MSDIAEVHPLVQSYLDGMARATAERQPGESFLVMFLGSTIGNFERKCAMEFLRDLRRALLPGDMLLMGADLVKERDRMLVAYDDPTGVTGAFNLNLLGRINRELGGDFQTARLRASGALERRTAPHRDASAFALESDRVHRAKPISRWPSAPARPSGPSPRTNSSSRSWTRWRSRPAFSVEGQWIDRDWPFAENLWTVR